MKLLAIPLVLGLGATACDQAPTSPEASPQVPAAEGAVVANDKIQFVETNFVPCADGGAGEDVELTVKLHVLITETVDASGGQHLTFQFQDAGSRGVGQVTGAVYRRVGVTRQTTNVASSGLPVEFTLVNIFDFIAPGPGNNFQVHDLIHLTVTGNGVTADVLRSTAQCK